MKQIFRLFAFLLLLLVLEANTNAQVNDVDGNAYRTTLQGTQNWTAENLDVSRFRNGDPIPEVKTTEAWIKASLDQTPAWCYYNNDPANGKKYGKLYNWYAVEDKRGLAPKGWHVPFEADWTKLVKFLEGQPGTGTGAKMKATGGWGNRPIDTNESGFAALPGGYRYDFGNAVFENIGKFANWWSATKFDSFDAYIHSVGFGTGLVLSNDSQGAGMGVRCVKD